MWSTAHEHTNKNQLYITLYTVDIRPSVSTKDKQLTCLCFVLLDTEHVRAGTPSSSAINIWISTIVSDAENWFKCVNKFVNRPHRLSTLYDLAIDGVYKQANDLNELLWRRDSFVVHLEVSVNTVLFYLYWVIFIRNYILQNVFVIDYTKIYECVCLVASVFWMMRFINYLRTNMIVRPRARV